MLICTAATKDTIDSGVVGSGGMVGSGVVGPVVGSRVVKVLVVGAGVAMVLVVRFGGVDVLIVCCKGVDVLVVGSKEVEEEAGRGVVVLSS